MEVHIMAQKKSPFTGLALSGFCMQVSLLYQAAVPLYEGLSVMAEDAHTEEEKEILTEMANNLRMGFSFSETVIFTMDYSLHPWGSG